MKKSGILVLLLILLLLSPLLLPLVKAQAAIPQMAGWIAKIGDGLSGFFRIAEPLGWGWPELLVALAVFVILIVAFGDIISNWTTLSKPASWVIAIGLGVIAALTSGVFIVTRALLSIAAGLGAISIVVALVTAFAAFAIVHLGTTGPLAKWIMRRKLLMMAMKETEEPVEAWHKLKVFERYTRRFG